MPATIANGNELLLHGDVGDMGGWVDDGDSGFTASQVIVCLAQLGSQTPITVRVNSGGGIATEGAAIHSALSMHKGKKTVVVEGIAASAASLLAMAGDEIVMAKGAVLMVHDPSGFTMGTVADHEANIRAMTAMADSMAAIYGAKAGKSTEAARADMQNEMWFTADQAVAAGYANKVAGDDVERHDIAAFDYSLYSHAPQKMVTMAKARRWTMKKPSSIEPPKIKDEPMPKTAEELAAEAAALAAATPPAPGEATLATEVPVVPVAPVAPITASAPASVAGISRSDAAAIATACVDGGVPEMTATLLAEGVTLSQAKERIASASVIIDIVAVAGRKNPAITAQFGKDAITAGLTVDQVKASLFDKMAADTDAKPVTSVHRAASGGSNAAGVTADVADQNRSKANMRALLEKNNMLSPKKEG